jgi:hypothetical protein
MIEHLKDFPGNVLAFVCKGHVTKEDYETVLVPPVVDALKKHGKVRLYYETADDFTGIDPGMEHLTRWERIAVVTDVDWIKHTMQFFSFMMPAQMKIFPLSEAAAARAWIAAT